jgi:rhodanese-related sulfurtransferase
MKRPFTLVLAFCLLACGMATVAAHSQQMAAPPVYKCLPCGQDCDKEDFAEDGLCRSCNMKLVLQSTITQKNISPEELCAFLKAHPKAVILDVRTKEEFQGKSDPNYGTLKKAINIPVGELSNSTDKINKYKNKQVIVYCSHGHRSATASYRLTQLGFKEVINMTGGMSELKDNSCKKN